MKLKGCLELPGFQPKHATALKKKSPARYAVCFYAITISNIA